MMWEEAKRNTFVAAAGSDALDASLLLLNEVGFLAADDPRFASTVAAIERTLGNATTLSSATSRKMTLVNQPTPFWFAPSGTSVRFSGAGAGGAKRGPLFEKLLAWGRNRDGC